MRQAAWVFHADSYDTVDWSKLGAFVTNPVSLATRTPAHGRRFIEFPGGFLLHTGYPNPGITQVIRHYSRHWSHSPIPIIVHLLAGNPEEVAKMAYWLEQVEGVSGLEVGVDSDVSFDMVTALTQGAYGEYPVIMRLPMERAIELAPAAIKAEAAAISLAPPRGIYPTGDGELVQGRLYGPAILPVVLRTVHELIKLNIPNHCCRRGVCSGGRKCLDSYGSLSRSAGQRLMAWRRISFNQIRRMRGNYQGSIRFPRVHPPG